jgi:uncharacterized protein (TIGR04222 family)
MKASKGKTPHKPGIKSTAIVPLKLAAAGPLQLPDVAPDDGLLSAPAERVDFEIDITDPYEIAHLRGGEKEVLKLMLFDLIERGYLEIQQTGNSLWRSYQVVLSSSHPPLERLSRAEREITDLLEQPLSPAEIFQMPFPTQLGAICADYQRRLEQGGLLSKRQGGEWIRQLLGWLIVLLIVIPASFVLPGSVVFLIAVAALILVFQFLPSGRLTTSGRKKLKDLARQNEHLKARPKTARADVHDPALILSVAVFGAAVLADSVHDAFADSVSGIAADLGGDGDGGDGCGGCGGCGCG